jgi:hypothetical protein
MSAGRMPAALQQGGRRGWRLWLLAGAVLGAITVVIPALLSTQDGFGFLAVLLGATGAVYLGFALQDGRTSALRTEGIGAVVFGAAAAYILLRYQ